MRLTKIAAVLACAMLLPIGSAFAQQKIRIATEGAYPPFNSLTADGTLVGFDVDIANALCAEMKAECEIVAQDWDGMIPALQAGKFDAIIASMSITEERKQQIDFSNPYYTTPLALVASKESDVASTEPAALNGKTIGAQASTTLANYAETNYAPAGAEVKSYPTQEEAMADLTNGRLDAVISDRFVLTDWMKTAASACCKLVGDVTGADTPAGIAVRKGDPLREKFNTALDAIIADGTYATIQAKYFDFDILGK